MGLYLLLEIITTAYIPATLRSRSLIVGTILGAIGLLIGIGLAIAIWFTSHTATWLLIPYLLNGSFKSSSHSNLLYFPQESQVVVEDTLQ